MGRKGSRLSGVGLTTKVKRLGDRARNGGEQSRTHTSTRASWARTVLAFPISQTILWGTRGLSRLPRPAGPRGLPPLPRLYSLLGTDVLALHRAAQHLAHSHAQPHVLEAQAQVLTRDGEPGASLPWACLW